MKMFREEDLHRMTNEEIELALKEFESEKERRRKIDKRASAISLREALHNFLEVGANYDFNPVCSLTTCDVDVCFDYGSEASEEDIDCIEFNPFNREVLLVICNELTRRIGNYEG